MTEARKIITVSCGPLSCTIEGFDDPLPLVREISAFFHSLTGAAAHAPQADAATAEAPAPGTWREPAEGTRVEATLSDSTFLVRPGSTAVAPPATAGEESVAAKLSRIRAAMARPPATMTEDEHAEDAFPRYGVQPGIGDTPLAAATTAYPDAAAQSATSAAPADATDPAEHTADATLPSLAAHDMATANAEMPQEDGRGFLQAAVLRLRPAGESDLIGAARTEMTAPDEVGEARTPGAGSTAPDAAASATAQGRTRHEAAAPQEDLSRLLSNAETRLSGQENRRRVSAIAHLKAAVAATAADRGALAAGTASSAAVEKSRTMARYRDDLSLAVRPPQILSGTSIPDVQTRRPAPLILVSSQRIDLPAAGEAFTVDARALDRINRGGAQTPYAFSAIGADRIPSFAEFARRLGASALDELMEAAAVHSVAIEGQPYFSRPEIIRKATSLAETQDWSRNAELRAFGTLLRQGRIVRVEPGQFAVSQSSRFYAAARSAAVSRPPLH